jgi:(R)-citramalate synthase
MKTKIEIMDTTLRDGEQVEHGSYPPEWKLKVVQALISAGVNRVEVASARGFSAVEQKMLTTVMEWARKNAFEDKIEVLTFVDYKKSADWVNEAGGRVINLLCKGSERHCHLQLDKTLGEHLDDIAATVGYATSSFDMTANIYLEDWSQGMINSRDYVWEMLKRLNEMKAVSRIMLCDTMGVLSFWQMEEFVRAICREWPDLHFDVHCHNDYGTATANTLAAIRAGAKGAHVTVNSLGERTGNAPLDELVVNIHDHLKCFCTDLIEEKLRPISKLVSLMSGRRVPGNKPISGANIFTNTAGIHADGNMKKRLYEHPLIKPKRFGARLKDAMGKLSGRASIVSNLEQLGWDLSYREIGAVLNRVVELGDQGKPVTLGDLPYIVASVLNRPECIVFEASVQTVSASNKKALVSANLIYKGREYEIGGRGDGGFDAFMRAVKIWARRKPIKIPKLLDFDASIPPGGSTSALVQIVIDWEIPESRDRFQTRGVHPDQVIAAIDAAVRAINLCNCNGFGNKSEATCI